MTSKYEIDEFGTKYWRNEKGQFHREDGPAVEYAHGSKYWYQNGKKHRIDGPAIEYENSDKFWYVNGKNHREDGPAIIFENGTKHWYRNDKLHREDGPAVEYPDGYKEYWLLGKRYSNIKTNEEWIAIVGILIWCMEISKGKQ